MKKYYDPEYDRIVDEQVIIDQYNWFKNEWPWFPKDYETFKHDNFMEVCTDYDTH